MYLVTTFDWLDGGFDDKREYPTLKEAAAVARNYVTSANNEYGSTFDGAAVYNRKTHRYLRVYGTYPSETLVWYERSTSRIVPRYYFDAKGGLTRA